MDFGFTITAYLTGETRLHRAGRRVWRYFGLLTWQDLWNVQAGIARVSMDLEWLQLTPEQRADPILNHMRIIESRDVL